MDEDRWQPGYVLEGRYELIKLVGTGGMGVVWRVFDTEWGRDLALKLPRAMVLESPPLRERYVREAETWVGLGVHPHIVQCWFVTEVEGVPALFLDYLTGGSLASWLKDGYLKRGQWEPIIEIAMQVTEGLAYAHSFGVIHRDIKPENLLIRGDERVCVTDFGLVKTAVDQAHISASGLLHEACADSSVTGVGAYLGTPMYGAPEQWGAAERVGPAADIYALGVTLYEMCCGRRPFDSDQEEVPPMDLIRRHLADPPPDPREFYPSVPAELAELCLLMLDKDPGKRPPHMAALRQRLHDVHRSLRHRAFRPAAQLPGAPSPDVLNNQAVSFFSLGKLPQALETLRRGLYLDPGHPECLYNLVQIERRYGRIGQREALRRLKQARAHFPLALLLIEEGLAAEALETLKAIPAQQLPAPGLHHRATGDALMYLGDYTVAEMAYAEAQNLMPKDALAAERRRLAAAGRGHAPDGAIWFPSARPIAAESHIDPTLQLALDARGEGLIGVNRQLAIYRSFRPGVAAVKVPRLSPADQVTQLWTHRDRLIIADSQGFEFRKVPDMELLARGEGRILACSPGLDHIVTLERKGPRVYVMATGEFHPILMKGQSPDQGPLLAAFDRSGQSLELLLPSGQLATVGEQNRAIPEAWPAKVEGHREARCLAFTGDRVALVGLADGTLRCYNLGTEQLEFAVHLPQTPSSLEVRAVGTRIVVRTAAGGFLILNRAGKILLSGDGPIAVTPDGKRALAVLGGRQMFYNLHPLFALRRWPEVKAENASSVGFSGDGRLAVITSLPGDYAIWEIDEDHRVYQRDLLLSPGRSYADILSADEQSHRHLTLAREALDRGDALESHRHLQRARKVPGQGHGEAALNLSWRLLETLKREQLEALWERLSLEEPALGDIDLHPDGREMLFSQAESAFLVLEKDGMARTIWSVCRRLPIHLLRFVKRRERNFVLIADESGEVALHHPADGRLVHQFALDGGPLAKASLNGNLLTYLCQEGGLGQFDLGDGSHAFREVAKFRPRLFAPWRQEKVLLTGSGSFGVLDLSKPGARPQALRLGVEFTKVPCFMEHLAECGLLALGFSSGTLHVLSAAGSGVLATLKHGEGNRVTSFALLEQLGVAVTTTARGQIFFWDLHTQDPLDDFLIHRNGVSALRACRGGRFLLTSGNDGILRYWETAWSAGGLRGSKHEIPWLAKA